jgi:hypothetical protein
VSENQQWQKPIAVHWDGLFRKFTQLLRHRREQNWIFILKTPFPQKLPDLGFTNPTSTVGLQLLNLWLLKVMLRCVDEDITTIKPRHLTIGNTSDIVRWVVLHAVPYIMKSLHLQNTQGSLQSGMLGSNIETRGRFCDGYGSNIQVQYSVCPIITLHGRITARDYVDSLGNQVRLMIQTLFPNNDVVFQDDNTPTHRAGTVQSRSE